MRGRVVPLILALSGASLASAGPGDPIGGQFQVNTYTTHLQGQASVAADAGGGFVVAWTSTGSAETDTNSSCIQAQRFDATGLPIGSQFQVNVHTPRAQHFPAVASLGAAGFVVVWQSYVGPVDPSAHGVLGRRYDALGAPLGGEFPVNTYTTGHQRNPSVVATAGGFVVAWGSESSPADPAYSVQAQRFDGGGTPLGTEFQLNTYTTGTQRLPELAADGAGGFIVVWDSSGSDGTDVDLESIQARRFDADGIPLGPEFQVNTYTTGLQAVPAIGENGNGGFVVTWLGYGSDGDDDAASSIQARLLDSSGAPVGADFQVNVYTTSYQAFPIAHPDGSGGFVVAWSSYGSFGTDPTGWSAQARRFDAMGNPVGGQFQVNAYTTGGQTISDVGPDGAGGFVAIWDSDGSFGDDDFFGSVQAQRYEGGTTTTSTSVVSTSSTTTSTTSSTSTTLPAGCAAAPLPGCTASGAGVLSISETIPGREKLKVVMKRLDAALSQAQLGDPLGGSTSYRVCLYDDAGVPVGGLLVDRAGTSCGNPPSSCWRAIGGTGYRYADRSASASGVTKMVLKGGGAGQGKATLKAANDGAAGQTSMPVGIAASLEGVTAATAQLVPSDAGCVTLALTTVRRADGASVKAKRP
jgi:hypothetical protein